MTTAEDRVLRVDGRSAPVSLRILDGLLPMASLSVTTLIPRMGIRRDIVGCQVLVNGSNHYGAFTDGGGFPGLPDT
jgi:hypothetical protein